MYYIITLWFKHLFYDILKYCICYNNGERMLVRDIEFYVLCFLLSFFFCFILTQHPIFYVFYVVPFSSTFVLFFFA